jgi:hypothetical protein
MAQFLPVRPAVSRAGKSRRKIKLSQWQDLSRAEITGLIDDRKVICQDKVVRWHAKIVTSLLPQPSELWARPYLFVSASDSCLVLQNLFFKYLFYRLQILHSIHRIRFQVTPFCPFVPAIYVKDSGTVWIG